MNVAYYYSMDIYQSMQSALDLVNDIGIHNNDTGLALNNRNLIAKQRDHEMTL